MIYMPYSDMGIPAEELLEQIFTKTQNLYKEICHSESDASSNHYEIFRLLTDLGRILINAGDAVLKHVAQILYTNMRICDGIYRWGGEEFIAILPDTDMDGAAETAERIRRAVQASICHFEDLDIKVTMSFGVTTIDRSKSIEDNIKDADEKLYKAKESGRNIVIK